MHAGPGKSGSFLRGPLKICIFSAHRPYPAAHAPLFSTNERAASPFLSSFYLSGAATAETGGKNRGQNVRIVFC
jgi:hypothetical protein